MNGITSGLCPEVIHSNRVQTLFELSDLIVATVESDEEVAATVPAMFYGNFARLVLCLGVSVSSKYDAPPGVMCIRDYRTQDIVRWLLRKKKRDHMLSMKKK